MVSEKIFKHAWYTEGAGQVIAQAEKAELDEILPTLYGYHLVQVGEPGLASFVNSSLISHRVLIHPAGPSVWPCSYIKGALASLPILSNSVDVVVLAHTLEEVPDPHQLLREAHRVLIPEGHLVITGFNPISFWGAWHYFKQKLGKIPRQGKMLSLNRVCDWLKLLDFQIVGGSRFGYMLPFKQYHSQAKQQWFEQKGRKYLPFLGGAYSVVGVKRVVSLTPIKPKWLDEEAWVKEVEGVPGSR